MSENLCPHLPVKEAPPLKRCVDCPMSVLNDWRQRGLRLRHELKRHKITDTERRLAEAILDITFGWGRENVMVPQLKYLCAMTGMEKPHISDAIASLHLQRIIRVVTIKGQPHYSLREDSENWKATPRELMQDMEGRLKQLRVMNDLPEDGQSFFKVCPAAKNKDRGVTEPVTKPVITGEETLPDLD